MKKYIAPEMEISKFEAVDIITVSGDAQIKVASGDASYSFGSENALYGEF